MKEKKSETVEEELSGQDAWRFVAARKAYIASNNDTAWRMAPVVHEDEESPEFYEGMRTSDYSKDDGFYARLEGDACDPPTTSCARRESWRETSTGTP